MIAEPLHRLPGSGPGSALTGAHLFSVDLEEHFHVNAFDSVLSRSDWDAQPSRVERNTGLLLELLSRHRATATFFALGWVAERQPALLRRIAAGGHEIASHTWWHRRISSLTPEAFRAEVRDSKRVLEDVTGQGVRGFRAPSFSVRPGMDWVFDILLEEGYTYDSSLFPIRRPDYGWPGVPPRPHQITRPGGTLLELPMATTEVLGLRLPAAGGGYLRHLPPALMDRALREHDREGIPAMLYIHPWEVDPEQPRLPVDWLTRVRHYRGLDLTLARLDRLMATWRFTSVANWLAAGPVA